MYALKGDSKISPILTLYLTHSMGSLILINGLIKYKLKYPLHVASETGISFLKFFVYVCFLSLFYNLVHIPKFYAMNYMSDVSIVSIYSASVLFTYIFSVIIISKNIIRVEICWVVIGLIGIGIMGIGNNINYMWWSIVVSSIFSGLYGVIFKVFMNKGIPKISFVSNKTGLTNSEPSSSMIVDRKSKINLDESVVLHDDQITLKSTFTESVASEKLNSDQESSGKNTMLEKSEDVIPIASNLSNVNITDVDKNKICFFGKEISTETNRRIQFMKHYISLTGAVTMLFYWPGLWFVNYIHLESINFPFKTQTIFHVVIANILSLSHNLLYFIIVAARTPLFAQISGIILQPTFLFLSILQKRGIACIGDLLGCILSFLSFLFLTGSEA